MKNKRRIATLLLLYVLGPPIAMFVYRGVMHHVGYSGSGTVRNKCGLPYGIGMFFDGMRIDGPVHYAYRTGPRGVRCVFVGTTDAEAVNAWVSAAAAGGDSGGGSTELGRVRSLANELPVDIHEYMDAPSDGDITASFAQPTPIVRKASIALLYRESTGHVYVSIYSPWGDLRRHSFWGQSWE